MGKLIFALCFLAIAAVANASVYQDFEAFPTTNETPGAVPGAPAGWQYSSKSTNDTGYIESQSSGWRQYPNDPEGDGWNWIFDYNRNGDCASHLGGGDTYGYLTITDYGHSGRALKYHVTGGLQFLDVSPCTGTPLGTELYNLETYSGPGDVYSGGMIGHMYIYFRKIAAWGSLRDYTPIAQIGNANRMTLYVKMPSEATNGAGGYAKPPAQTLQLGAFVNPSNPSGHYYYNVFTQGGGWTKITLDETPNGNNGSVHESVYYPGFLGSLWEFYLTSLPYSGNAKPPYDILVDDIEFSTDTYPNQNNVTISNIAVMYRDSDATWEISFNDTFKTTNSHSTWELRYSFSPITNENWDTSTPATIIADARFDQLGRADGKFNKHWPDSQAVWAHFSLSPLDTGNLSPGSTLYFAVKDISQVGSNTKTPVAGIGSRFSSDTQGGRPFSSDGYLSAYTATWAEISAALPLIKRVSYTVSSFYPIPGSCGPPNGLALPSAPMTGLCVAGTPSAVSGTGPWSWTCAGSGGGDTASCSATLATPQRSISVKFGGGGRLTGTLK